MRNLREAAWDASGRILITGVDVSDQTDETWRNSLTEMVQAFVRAGVDDGESDPTRLANSAIISVLW